MKLQNCKICGKKPKAGWVNTVFGEKCYYQIFCFEDPISWDVHFDIRAKTKKHCEEAWNLINV